MSEVYKTLKLPDDQVAEIYLDEDCSNPFEDDEGVKIAVLSRRYIDPSDGACGRSPEEMEQWVKDNPDWYTVPLWLYDHSGTSYAVGPVNPFHCPWDSGRVGIIALKRSEWGDGNPSDEQLLTYAQNVAKEYTDWANGNCFGYVIKDAAGNETDSCWGFVGIETVEDEIRAATSPARAASPTP